MLKNGFMQLGTCTIQKAVLLRGKDDFISHRVAELEPTVESCGNNIDTIIPRKHLCILPGTLTGSVGHTVKIFAPLDIDGRVDMQRDCGTTEILSRALYYRDVIRDAEQHAEMKLQLRLLERTPKSKRK